MWSLRCLPNTGRVRAKRARLVLPAARNLRHPEGKETELTRSVPMHVKWMKDSGQ